MTTRTVILRRSEEKALSVKVRQKDKTEADETVRVIDFNGANNNDFFLASQF